MSALPRLRDSPLLPLPPPIPVDPALAELGQALFFSPILSEDGQVSCGNCHNPEHGLAENRARPWAPGRSEGARNSPSLFNIAYLHQLTWSGAYDSLESHLDALIENPKLMRSSWFAISARLAAEPQWVQRFRAVFSDGVTQANARAALLGYERSLTTPGAPLDRWLAGDDDALGPEAEAGYRAFINYGCVSCHQGSLVGGNLRQRFGVARGYIGEHPQPAIGAPCLSSAAQREDDGCTFRVPSLRNVALTAPYLHDGSAPTLESAISIMGEVQLGWELPNADVTQLAAFLRSLTGQLPGELARAAR